MTFAAPAAAGDLLPAADVLNHLLLVAPTEYRTGIVTRFNKPENPTSDAIVVDVAVLTQQDAAGQVPVYHDVLWFNVGLRLTLKKQIGQMVLCRMGQGEGKQGQDPPYQLIDATTDAQAVAFAEQWLTQNPNFETDANKKTAEASGQAGRVVSVTTAPAVPATPAVPSIPSVPQAAPVNAAPAVPQVPMVPGTAPGSVNGTSGSVPTAGAVTIDPAVIASLPADQQAAILALMGQQPK